MADPLPFAVRAWPIAADAPPEDTPFSRLGPAIDLAQQMARLTSYRTVAVIDQRAMVYAQFNMLWSVPRERR